MKSSQLGGGGGVQLGGYGLFSGNRAPMLTLPDGKVFLKAGVLAAAAAFPTVPAAHVADLNPLKKVSDIGSGGMFVGIVIDPNTNLPLLLSRGHGNSLISISHLNDPSTDVRVFDGTAAQLCGPALTAVNATRIGVHKGATVFGFNGALSPNAGAVPVWSFFNDGTGVLGYVGVNLAASAGISCFASNPAGNLVALHDVNTASGYYSATGNANPTAMALPVAAQWKAAAFGSNVFAAVAAGGTQAASSPDGVNWTARVLPAAAAWSALASSGTLFVAVSGGASTQAASSPDGINWTSRVLPAAADWSAVSHNGVQWCAVAKNSNTAATSPDGINWTKRTLPATADWCDVRWSSVLGAWFAVASDGRAAVAVSTDGITWTSRAVGVPSFTFNSLLGGGGTTLYAISSSTYTGGQFLVARSTDSGATWRYHQPNTVVGWSGSVPAVIKVMNGQLVAIAGQQPSPSMVRIATSADGITWAQGDRNIPNDPNWFQTADWNGTVYCLTANSYSNGSQNSLYVWTSPDLISWTARNCNSGITTDTWRLTAAGTNFVAVVGSSFPRFKAMVSTDNGVTWTLAADPGNGLSASDVWYDAQRDVVAWTSNNGSQAYLSINKGLAWVPVARVHTAAPLNLGYEAGFVRAGSNGSWASYSVANVSIMAGKLGGYVKLTYPHGFTLAQNKTQPSAFGPIPVDQGGNRYYLTTNNVLVTVDAVPYIDNTKTAGEFLSTAAVPNLNYYMRVQ